MHIVLVKEKKTYAPGEDRTHDLQIALFVCDYETDALPTALPRHISSGKPAVYQVNTTSRCKVQVSYSILRHNSNFKTSDIDLVQTLR